VTLGQIGKRDVCSSISVHVNTTAYREIVQSMKYARKQLNIPAWHRRRADKL